MTTPSSNVQPGDPGHVAHHNALASALAGKAPGEIKATAPTTSTVGYIWVNSSTYAIKVWDGSAFVDPSNGGAALRLTASDITGTTGSPTITTYTDSGIGYTVYKFTGDGSITVSATSKPNGGICDVLVIGGGGGSGYAGNSTGIYWASGAGGAGAYLEGVVGLLPGSNVVKVGSGGAAGASQYANGGNGNPSGIQQLQAVGGGGGSWGARQNGPTVGLSGASGGGGGSNLNNAAATGGSSTLVVGFGSAGGTPGNPSNGEAGGGGGAGGAASAATAGVGKASTITGSSVTYAAGGAAYAANDGTANTGNGAGSTQQNGSGVNTAGKNGGSGVVIIRVRT